MCTCMHNGVKARFLHRLAAWRLGLTNTRCCMGLRSSFRPPLTLQLPSTLAMLTSLGGGDPLSETGKAGCTLRCMVAPNMQPTATLRYQFWLAAKPLNLFSKQQLTLPARASCCWLLPRFDSRAHRASICFCMPWVFGAGCVQAHEVKGSAASVANEPMHGMQRSRAHGSALRSQPFRTQGPADQ